MGAERLVARCQILLGVGAQIAEGGRQTVAAMLLGNAAERPQGILQTFGQRHKALAAEHHMGVFKTRKRQTEVIEALIEKLAGDGDAKIVSVGEVR
jgi:hypothetical protein